MVKNLPANAGHLSSIPGLERSLGEGNGNPLQDSCLGNPMDRGAWRAAVHRVARVEHDLVTKPPLHPCEKLTLTMVVLPCDFQLTKSVFLIPFTQRLLCTRFPEHDLPLTWLLLCKTVFEDSNFLFLALVFGFEFPNVFRSCPHCIQLVVSGSKENNFYLCLFNYWIFKIQKVLFFSITKCTFS